MDCSLVYLSGATPSEDQKGGTTNLPPHSESANVSSVLKIGAEDKIR